MAKTEISQGSAKCTVWFLSVFQLGFVVLKQQLLLVLCVSLEGFRSLHLSSPKSSHGLAGWAIVSYQFSSSVSFKMYKNAKHLIQFKIICIALFTIQSLQSNVTGN